MKKKNVPPYTSTILNKIFLTNVNFWIFKIVVLYESTFFFFKVVLDYEVSPHEF